MKRRAPSPNRIGLALAIAACGAARDPAAPPEVSSPTEAELEEAADPVSSAPSEVQQWVAEHAIPIATVEAGHGFDDLASLKNIVGDARIVALGESTHGTREFFQLKHRMLEFLVTQMGFTVFAIEASMPEAYAIDEYVVHGRGDAATALAGTYFWTWNTAEVLAMIEWMRAYNADPAHTEKLRFYGFDMQYAPVAMARVLDYLRRVDSHAVKGTAAKVAPLLDAFALDQLHAQTQPDWRRRVAAVASLAKRFDAQRIPWIARTDVTSFETARQDLRVVEQWLSLFQPGPASE
ncbi:MAG TPA: erythromycin esterase family protein, partial [Nannocystaceae bacterium]|nr:erythromycin esterase family protein [Nannocystaceae bacterium]